MRLKDSIYDVFIDVRQELRPQHKRVLSGVATKGGNKLAERLHNTIR